VRDNVLVDNEALTDFVNLKIKPTQSFECVYRVRVYIFIWASAHTCMSIYVCTVFLKKSRNQRGVVSWCARWAHPERASFLGGINLRFVAIYLSCVGSFSFKS
jgi:hypothetical protein